VGQPVERGDVIGFVGQSGLAIGPHLHYEVLVNGRQMNPRRFIFDGQAIPD
jgi:murein DD-endopeptidase MepM/ murein hydrolase activator NlpD